MLILPARPEVSQAGNQPKRGQSRSTSRTAATWNPRGQLTALTSNGTAHTFGYTGETNKERVSFDGVGYQNNELGVTTQSGSSSSTVIREPDGTPVALRVGSSSYYFVADRMGSTVAIVDSSGSVKNSYSYDPYGVSRAKSEQVANSYQYIGGQLDLTTGLYHLQNRYYDPSIGRFTQLDPSGRELNTYIYALANPTNFSDRTGLDVGAVIGAGLGGIAAAVITGLVCLETAVVGCVVVAVVAGGGLTASGTLIGAGFAREEWESPNDWLTTFFAALASLAGALTGAVSGGA